MDPNENQKSSHLFKDPEHIDQNNSNNVNSQKRLSLSLKISLYILFAFIGIFLFYMLLVISAYITWGYLELGIPDAAFYNYIFTLIIGIPLYLLFGVSIAHVLIHKKIGKFFILVLIPVLIGSSVILWLSFESLINDNKIIKEVNNLEDKLSNECNTIGFYQLIEYPDTEIDNILDPSDPESVVGEAECEYFSGDICTQTNIIYYLDGFRGNAIGISLDDNGPEYGYAYKVTLTCNP